MKIDTRPRLQEIATIRAGGSLQLTGKHFVATGVPAFGAGGLNGYVTTSEHEGSAIILSSIGARCGKCFYVDGKWTSLANTQVILPDPERVDARFLWYQLNDERRWHRSGTAQPFIKPSDVKNSRVLLPSMAEQRRIAEVLDRAEALLTKRRKTLGLLSDLAESIFLDMFGDPGRTTSGLDSVAIGDICRVIRGASPRPAGDPRYFGGAIPWLKISDVTASEGRFVRTIREGVTEAGRERSVYLEAGTLILTNSATVGVAKFLALPACIHDGFIALLDLDPRVNPGYLHAALTMMRPQLVALAPEGTQKNLNTPLVKAFRVPLPTLEAQKEFMVRLTAIEDASVATGRHGRLQIELLSSLQQRAFSGEL